MYVCIYNTSVLRMSLRCMDFQSHKNCILQQLQSNECMYIYVKNKIFIPKMKNVYTFHTMWRVYLYNIYLKKNSHWRRLCIRLFIVRHDVSTSWCVNMLVLPWTLFYFTMHLSLFFSLVCLFSFSFNYVSLRVGRTQFLS